MEQLLHYLWKHRMLPLGELLTTDGRVVEVLDPGLHNHNQGPDFFNAKVRINGDLWVGNVELHMLSSDWYRHRHDRDAAYDNVVLHVVNKADGDVQTSGGLWLPQLELPIPRKVLSQYTELVETMEYPKCYRIIPKLTRLMVHSWMSALETDRLEQRTLAIWDRLRESDGDWEKAYFMTLARSFGFGVNADAFEIWARSVPMRAVDHHRDDLFQVEALFIGQAGLIPQPSEGEDEYITRLRREYQYLKHKFSLEPMDSRAWRLMRMRPQNFPLVRLAQLAMLYHEQRSGLRQLLACETMDDYRQLFTVGVSDYWQTHYMPGKESRRSAKRLTEQSVSLLLINTAVPILFAYGRKTRREELCDRAFDVQEQLRAENNMIVRMWQKHGLEVSTAGDSQALIQLKKQYCDRKDCLRCRIGYEYLKV